MSGSKRPVWLFVAVVLGLAVVAYLALRPQPGVLPAMPSVGVAQPASRPTTLAQVLPPVALPATAMPAPANVPAALNVPM